MWQSSGGQKADKRAPEARDTERGGAPLGALVGAVLLTVGGVWGHDALAVLPPPALAAIGAATIGAALLLAYLVLRVAGASAAGAGAEGIADALDAVAAGDYTVEPEPRGDVADLTLVPAARRAIANSRTLLATLRAQARETAARADDLSSQANVVQSTAQRAAEVAALAVHGSSALAESASRLGDDGARLHQAMGVLARDLREGLERAARLRDALHAAQQELDAERRALELVRCRRRPGRSTSANPARAVCR